MKIRLKKVCSYDEFELEFPDKNTCLELVGMFCDACTEDIGIIFEKERKEKEDGNTL